MNIYKIRQNISCLMLLLFIIGYFFHEVFYAIGIINRLPFGFIGFLNIIFTIIFITFFVSDYKKYFLSNKYAFAVIIFFIYAILWSFINKVTIKQHYSDVAFTQMLLTIALLFMLYVVTFYNNFLKSKIYLIYFCILVFLYFLYFSIYQQTFTFNLRKISLSNSEDFATYQGLARSVSLASVFVLPFIKRRLFLWLFSCTSLFSVFILGSRSELIFLLIFILSIILINLTRDRMKDKIGIFFLCTIAIVLTVLFTPNITSMDNRNLQLFDIEDSTSYQGRSYFRDIAFKQVYESPILGDFGGHIYATGSEGGYSHDFFSSWVNLGLVGFVFYLLLILIPIFMALKEMIFRRVYSENLIFIVSFGLSTLVLIVFAKPFFWPVPAILWGSYSSHLISYGKY